MNESSSFMNVIFNYCSPNLWKCSSQQLGRIRPAPASRATGYSPLRGPCRGGASACCERRTRDETWPTIGH